MANQSITLPGVAVKIDGYGVLIQGVSGIGKSQLALSLIQANHALIADDAVQLTRNIDNTIELSCPPTLRNLLEIRNFGILNIKDIYGEKAIAQKAPCQLIIQLEVDSTAALDRLNGSFDYHALLDIKTPMMTIGQASQRPLPALVKLAVRRLSSHEKSWKM
jgi:HPr kinase/phosphorylase